MNERREKTNKQSAVIKSECTRGIGRAVSNRVFVARSGSYAVGKSSDIV